MVIGGRRKKKKLIMNKLDGVRGTMAREEAACGRGVSSTLANCKFEEHLLARVSVVWLDSGVSNIYSWQLLYQGAVAYRKGNNILVA